MLARCVSRRLPCRQSTARVSAALPIRGRRWHCDELPKPGAARVSLVYVDTKSGKRMSVECLEGENLLHVAHKNAIDLEGACECSLACSTCHVVLTPPAYNLLDEPSDAENDMLDLAYGLTATSRLGCQVRVDRRMEGTEVRIPVATRNFYVDGHKPKPH